MNPPDSIVFDLDGTLWDTCEPCAIAWNNVLASEGIEYRTIVADDVRKVTGKPHEECIRQTFVGFPEEQIIRISEATMTEDNRVIAELGGTLYEGVRDGLPKLQQKYRLFIVSNCQQGYIETFLRLNGFERYFEDIECWGNTGQPKAENLRRVIERNNLQSPVMVGDADGDETAARVCGIPFLFVEYGFGQCVKPDLSFKTFEALLEHYLAAS